MTLGISTNTRLLGLAIIDSENSLVDYKIHLHKASWSPGKANMIISSLEPCVRQYCIKKVVLSIPPTHHQTEGFRYLMERVKRYFRTKLIPVFERNIAEFHQLIPEGERKLKKVLMQALTLQFPQLTLCYKKELRNRKRYYMKLFEAVAGATLVVQGR